MKKSRQDIGKLGETLAARYLKKQGFKIIETNYHCPLGEIDIIAQQKDCLVFIEVRTKTGSGFGSPEESVTRAKKKKMINTAYFYVKEYNCLQYNWRIDFIAVELDQNYKPSRIELFQNAISE
ncbi:MAG: YraN family protein [Dehalococcoidales bacterium]|nr:YraN family protein [Dehalococcoidales bacterium]